MQGSEIRAGITQVGLLPNLEKPEAVALARELAAWFRRRGLVPVCHPEAAAAVGSAAHCEVLPCEAWRDKVAFAITLGGDGTLLKAARILAPLGVPLLGVNLGRLGFLSEVEAEQVFEALPAFLAGCYVIDRREMLDVAVVKSGGGVCRFLALNDVVVTPGTATRLGRLAVYVGDSHLGTFPADGVILATPTGSTAYSLAAGGPVLSPDLDALVITPVCAHTFYARPTVISKAETVVLRVERSREGGMVTMDGQERCRLTGDDEVRVRAAQVKALLMRRPGWDFYAMLRRKLRGDDACLFPRS